jgi:2-oxoglutarate dehydrogenase E2 component (dihydrolipoamide succinyltransferase)
MATEVKVPTLGESVTEATVAKWFKSAGDAVAVDEPLCELETDKVTVEVPSPVAGALSEIIAADGAEIEVGALLCLIEEGAAGAAPSAKPAAAAAAPAAAAPAPAAAKAPAAGSANLDYPLAPSYRQRRSSDQRRRADLYRQWR